MRNQCARRAGERVRGRYISAATFAGGNTREGVSGEDCRFGRRSSRQCRNVFGAFGVRSARGSCSRAHGWPGLHTPAVGPRWAPDRNRRPGGGQRRARRRQSRVCGGRARRTSGRRTAGTDGPSRPATCRGRSAGAAWRSGACCSSNTRRPGAGGCTGTGSWRATAAIGGRRQGGADRSRSGTHDVPGDSAGPAAGAGRTAVVSRLSA